ncbi:Elongation factor 1-beta [Irineochytrium annulatum]|nr:Elongation factor 1-beta [Irineochytrium annulatum]
MGFSNLDQDSGLAVLNSFLEEHSYIEGFTPSQADVAVIEALKSAPKADKYPHASRWYTHITAHGGKNAKFPGTKKAISSYGPSGAAATTTSKPASRSASPSKPPSRGTSPSKAAKPAKAEEEDENDIDLFGDDDDEEEDEAKKALTEQRLKEYHAKKAAKGPKPEAKSLVVLDVKPWDDETDMKALEAAVRSIEIDGLLWGTSKLVPVGYGIKKLSINAVVVDDKVSTNDLEEKIAEFEDYVQSVDIASFNKL